MRHHSDAAAEAHIKLTCHVAFTGDDDPDDDVDEVLLMTRVWRQRGQRAPRSDEVRTPPRCPLQPSADAAIAADHHLRLPGAVVEWWPEV